MHCDVVVVGGGPVGQALAGLLGIRGHSVTVFERYVGRYELPRAAHLDGEALRIYQQLGVADQVHAMSWPQTRYDFLNMEGKLLHHVDLDGLDVGGWRKGYFCFGPDVESLVETRLQSLVRVTVRRGARVTALVEHPDGVRITAQIGDDTEEAEARYVVGADGANSFVRGAAGIGMEDLGFSADWLVVDVELADPDVELDIPEAAQFCHPRTPVSAFRRLGHRHTRLEFPLDADDDASMVEDPSAVWRRLADWGLHPDNATLVRHTVYTFRSLIADTFSAGRVHLAGDSAHLMPPFLGQGLCSGLRDADALAWRLDRVLRGASTPDLLSTYTPERRSHAREMILASVHAGRVVTLPDDEAVAAALSQTPAVVPPVTDGFFGRDPEGQLAPHAASMALQSVVEIDGRVGRLDDLVGPRWAVLSRGSIADATLRRLQALDIGAFSFEGDPGSASILDDREDRYLAWLDGLAAHSVIVRPDHRVFGIATDDDGLAGLVSQLEDGLCPLPGGRGRPAAGKSR